MGNVQPIFDTICASWGLDFDNKPVQSTIAFAIRGLKAISIIEDDFIELDQIAENIGIDWHNTFPLGIPSIDKELQHIAKRICEEDLLLAGWESYIAEATGAMLNWFFCGHTEDVVACLKAKAGTQATEQAQEMLCYTHSLLSL